MVFKKIINKLKEVSGNTLFYTGCLTKFAAPELGEQYEKILNHIGVDFIKIEEFNCCGSPVLNAGYKDDYYDLAQKNKEIFKKYGITRIISSCPSCVKMFKNDYKMNAYHITEIIIKHLKKFETVEERGPISYHDPCHLGRGLGIYKIPRDIIKHIGFELVEAPHNHNSSLCCGGGGGLRTNNPKMANKAAQIRIEEMKTRKVITTCPLCYKHLKENSGPNVEVYELSEVLL